MTDINTRIRYFAPHETGYWPAQRDGFATIRQIEEALDHETCFDQEIENQLHGVLHAWRQSDIDAHAASSTAEIAKLTERAARGHAVPIIRAQQRSDEVA